MSHTSKSGQSFEESVMPATYQSTMQCLDEFLQAHAFHLLHPKAEVVDQFKSLGRLIGTVYYGWGLSEGFVA